MEPIKQVMKQVLHYKTNFLNSSETFINRLIRNHTEFEPIALCYRKKSFADSLQVYEVPKSGLSLFTNVAAFHLNRSLPFYNKVIRDVKPDIIHSHFGYDGMKMAELAIKHQISHVVSFYGSDVSRLPGERGWKRRYRNLAGMADHFIAASAFMKNQLVNLGFQEKKISVVRFGLDTDQLRFRENYNLNPDVMMVGRMVEKKGFEYAIKSLFKLKRSGLNLNLNLFGNGPLLPGLQSLVRTLEMENTVHFHGFQPVEKIIDAHSKHALLIAPSVKASDGDMEGLPNTILESMALGTPVIATRHAAIPEAVEHNKSGFLVDEKDIDGLASILSDIYNNQFDLEQIRRNARNRIEDEYRVNRMVQDTERIYNELLTGMAQPH